MVPDFSGIVIIFFVLLGSLIGALIGSFGGFVGAFGGLVIGGAIAEVIAEHGGPGHGQKLAGSFILAPVVALFFVIIYLMRKERVRLFKELRGDKTGD